VSNSEIKFNSPTSLSFIIVLTVPFCDGRLKHLCHKLNVYGKEQHPQGNHLHQRQGGGSLRQADTFRDEQARERAEPHGHRLGRVHLPRQENQGAEAVPL